MSGLRITSANSQNLRALDGAAQPIRDEIDTRLDAKIEVLRAFCAVNDHVIPIQDLRDAIVRQDPGSVDLESMSLALHELQFDPSATYVAALSLTKFPVLAQMSEDQFVIILGQDGGEVVLYDTSSPNNRAMVALDQFEAFFTGHLLQVTKIPEAQKMDKKTAFEPK
jgi:ATP-binding cassette subfamily C protein LapB